jgi:hypothetical protein
MIIYDHSMVIDIFLFFSKKGILVAMQIRKLIFIPLLLPLLLSVALAGCGTPPNSFTTSSSNELDYIYWNDDNNQLSGSLIQVKSEATASTIPITGTLQNNHLTINAMSITFMTGDIDSNNLLQVAGADTSGHSQETTWYPINKDDYNTLNTAFNSHIKLAGLLQNVDADIKGGEFGPATDSTSAAADSQVQQDQSIVTNNDDLIALIKQPYGCFAAPGLSQASDNFQISDEAKNPTFATLNSDFKSVQQQWNSTKNAPIPSVNLPMPWRITQAQIDTLTAAVSARKKQIAAQIVSDQAQLDKLKGSYETQVTQYNQTYQQQCQSH